jgi:hypothetical protein
VKEKLIKTRWDRSTRHQGPPASADDNLRNPELQSNYSGTFFPRKRQPPLGFNQLGLRGFAPADLKSAMSASLQLSGATMTEFQKAIDPEGEKMLDGCIGRLHNRGDSMVIQLLEREFQVLERGDGPTRRHHPKGAAGRIVVDLPSA